jgi:hypothetical protein
MQYTIRGIPAALDQALRKRARIEEKSLNEMAIEAMSEALGIGGGSLLRRDLNDIVGTWRKDPEFEAAIREQDRIDPKLWK